MQASAPSLKGRVALALTLLIGFYVIAFAIVGFFTWAIVYSLTAGEVRPRVLIGGAIVIVAIVRGIFFINRDDDVEGVRVTDADQPGLWSLVRDVARRMGAEPPDEIVLVPDVNAFVYQRSRMMGLVAGDRVMGVGMGLLSVLRVDQLRGVIAHELGHYAGGDTRIGPLLYRADESLRRTVTHLSGGFLAWFFRSYWHLFARLTLALRRRQELAADRAAVAVAGREAHSAALTEIGPAAVAYGFFVNQYVVPLLQAGRRPDNLYTGFRSLLNDPGRADELSSLKDAMHEDETDPYDSHPALPERLANAASAPESQAEPDPRPALEVLSSAPAAEEAVTRQWSLNVTGGQATQVAAWDSGAGEVYGRGAVQTAEALAEAVAAVDAGPSPADLDRVLAVLADGRHDAVALKLVSDIASLTPSERTDAIGRVITEALTAFVAAYLVTTHGWQWTISWSGPLQVRTPEGETVDVEQHVAPATVSAHGVAELREWLSGLPAR